MASRNVLILVLDPVPDEKIQKAIAARKDVEDLNVHVVAPAAGVGPLQWLTGAEDEARAEAEQLADRTADAVDADVETEVGEHDPLLAVEDALRVFPADEILVAGTADEKAEAALRRLDLPISRLDGGREIAGEEATGAEALARDAAQGRSPETPFVVVSSVAAVVTVVVVLISLIAFLVLWLT
jgi:hypothetical protein